MPTGIIPVNSEFLVNTTFPFMQEEASVSSLADGGYVVVWRAYDGTPGEYDVYFQRFGSDGVAAGAETLVNTVTTGNQLYATVTGLTGGGFVVSWSSPGIDSNQEAVVGQMYNAAGVAVGSNFQINTYELGSQYGSSIAALGDGGFLVIWDDASQDGSLSGIYAQRYTSAGVASGTEFLVNTTTDSFQTFGDVTDLNDGGFVVTWSGLSDGSSFGVYGQRYNAAGVAAGSEFIINTTTENSQIHPSVSGLTGGGFVVTWDSYEQDGELNGIYAQRFDASGVAVGGEISVNTTTAKSQDSSSVAGLPDGGFIVTWTSYWQDSVGTNGVYAQRFDAAGDPVGGEVQVNTYTTNHQENPDVAVLSDGGFVITWDSLQQIGSWEDIFAQEFKAMLYGTSGNDIITDTFGTDWINGQAGRDTLNGMSGADTIYGAGGNDRINGGTGDDDLYGGQGKDRIKGGKGDDTIDGQGGNDKITGGKGQDIMTGGDGLDTFIFTRSSDSATNANADVITDFVGAEDRIDLSAFGATYVGAAGFSGTGAEVRVVTSGADVLVRVDVDGDGSADMKIVLEGAFGIYENHFIL